MSVISNNQLAGAAGQGGDAAYQVDRSLRFNSGDSAYLNKTFSAGDRRKWTWSGWVKRSNLTTQQALWSAGSTGTNRISALFNTSGSIRFFNYAGSVNVDLVTTSVYRDVSAWYHVVICVDTTQATSTDRVKLYVNGVQVTAFSTATYPTLNQDLVFNSAIAHAIGRGEQSGGEYFNGYLADVHFVDGQALAPTDFGEYDDNNVWQPKEFTGSYTSTNTSTTLSQTGWTVSSPTSENTIWDGNTSTQSNGHNGGIIGTVSFSPALTNVTKVEVYQQNYVHYLNGSSVTTSQSGTGWHTLYDNSSSPITLNSVGNSYTNNTQTVDIMAIRINDSIVDSKTWTPPSGVGVQSTGANSFYLKCADNSSNAALGTDSSGNSNTWTVNNLEVGNAGSTVASASGALPILNTSGDYGGTVTSGVRSDSLSSNIVLALPLNGSNGSTTITDYHHTIKGSGSAKAITLFSGSTSGGAVIDTSQSQYYGSSFYAVRGGVNANQSDYITRTGDTDLNFGTGDFTVEFWYRPTTLDSNQVIFDNRHPTTGWPNSSNGYSLVCNGSGTITFYTGGNNRITASNALSVGTWSHITVDRDGGTTTIRVNGVNKGSWSDSNNYNEGRFLLGSSAPNGEGANGHFADLRIYKGDAKYTADFAVPSVTDFSNSDSLIDTPTNYTAASGNNGGNYATLNPLAISPNVTPTLSNGNLEIERTATSSEWTSCGSTFVVSSGKYYWELSLPTINGTVARWGVADADDYEFNRSTTSSGLPWLGSGTGTSWSMDVGGNTHHNGSAVSSSYTSTVTTSDVIGVALDCDANTLTFYKNGTSLGTAHSNVTASRLVPAVGLHGGTHNKIVMNFGQRPFKYTPPSGYKALCTTNLPESTVADGSTAMDVALWTANGSNQTISGLNFSPDLVWAKSRNTGSTPHLWVDTVRGASQVLYSHSTGAEQDYSGISGVISSFNSNGFDTGGNSDIATNNRTFVGWAWDAGTSNTSISVGGLNSSAYDQSQTWSSNTYFNNNGNGYNGSNTITKLFDGVAGSVSADGVLPAGSGDFTLDFGTTFSSASTVTFDLEGGGNSLKVNGSFVTLPGGSRTTVTYNVSGLSTIQWYHGAGSNYCFLLSIKVDGKELVDNGVSITTNVPSIASTVRANPSAGFSIVSATAPSSNTSFTLGHGLNATPSFIIFRQRTASNWAVYHSGIASAETKYLHLNSTNAVGTATTWNNTAPTSNVFSSTMSGNWDTNVGLIAYCFAPVEGYSAFGSYTGNGSADGPFVYTGFRPKYLLIKRTNSSKAWQVMDTERDSFNVADTSLFPAGSDAEASSSNYDIDFLSNGFKIRTSHDSRNGSSDTYIYAAFAEHPFKNSRAR